MATAVESVAGEPAEYTHQAPARPKPFISKTDVPVTPRTPILSRSISGAFGSPGSYSRENEETIVYELTSRHFSAGFAGEARPRCIWRFGYHESEFTRTGDYAPYLSSSRPKRRRSQYELYRNDLRSVDLGLVHDRLERVVQMIHIDHLQLDQKPRRAVLVVPTLLPTRILDTALNVLFNHYSQPPSITLLNQPTMSCVSAGLRDGLVINIGWEDTTVTAIGEYKVVSERRSDRAEAMLHDLVAQVLSDGGSQETSSTSLDFAFAEEVRSRMLCCETQASTPRPGDADQDTIAIPVATRETIKISRSQLSQTVEKAFFVRTSTSDEQDYPDDNDLALPDLAYEVLVRLQNDFRASCASRIVTVGSASRIPGLRHKIIAEIQQLIEVRQWRIVRNRGSASGKSTKDETGVGTPTLKPQDQINIDNDSPANNTKSDQLTESADSEATESQPSYDEITASSPVDIVERAKPPAARRNHDDANDPVTMKAERESNRRRPEKWSGKARFVDSLGAWAGASMVASLKVKGIHEIERDDYVRHGLKEHDMLYL